VVDGGVVGWGCTLLITRHSDHDWQTRKGSLSITIRTELL
jgi:hypothetical protein